MLAECLQPQADSNGCGKTPSMVGGGRGFESVRGLCKSAGNRRFLFRVDLQVLERGPGMEPFMEPSGRKVAVPPRAAALRETKMEATTTRTTIAVAYGIAVATRTIAVSRRRSCRSSRSSPGRRCSSRCTAHLSSRASATAITIAAAPQSRRSKRPAKNASIGTLARPRRSGDRGGAPSANSCIW